MVLEQFLQGIQDFIELYKDFIRVLHVFGFHKRSFHQSEAKP